MSIQNILSLLLKFVLDKGYTSAKILKLSALLIDAGRTDDLKKAAENEEFCQKLCEEFHIS